jgi:hypothetical protein
MELEKFPQQAKNKQKKAIRQKIIILMPIYGLEMYYCFGKKEKNANFI